MDQTGQQIFSFLSHYGYWIMLPLMIVEGPVVTIISSILAKLGAFNIWLVFFFSVLGDIIGDVILYYLGYKFGLSFVEKIGKYIGITEQLVSKMKKYFDRHGGKTIFAVKSTTGLCWATFAAAGIVRMDFRKFLKNSFLGGLVWSGFLVAMGYFYGFLWKEIRDSISWIGWAISLLAIITFSFIQIYKYRQAKKIIAENGNNEK
jgi:membrane protein DedA with SNARE-associated domain